MLLTGEIPMNIAFCNRTIVALAVGLTAVSCLSLSAQAKGRSVYFNASAATIKSGCDGQHLGTNKDGFYGCIAKDGKSVTTCKKGRCVKDPT
jgi:hypothetical protein